MTIRPFCRIMPKRRNPRPDLSPKYNIGTDFEFFRDPDFVAHLTMESGEFYKPNRENIKAHWEPKFRSTKDVRIFGGN